MNFSDNVLLVLLLSIFTNANNVDLNTNTNFLLLLLLTLSSNQQSTCPGTCGCGGTVITCPGRTF